VEGVAEDADMKPLKSLSTPWRLLCHGVAVNNWQYQERRLALCRLTLFYTN
jgi:hypothetical protein